MLNPWRLRLLSRLDVLGTVRAVAKDVNLSASTVSHQLAVLETETRTRLLERTGRRVRLTPAGQKLARQARAILDHLDAIEAELRGDEPAGLVRIGAFQSAIHTFVVPAVTRLAATFPRLETELVEREPHDSVPALRAGDSDVVITTTDFSDLPLGPDLDIVRLATDPIVLVTAPGGPRGPAVLADYAAEPWALDVPPSYMAHLTLRLCRESGFEPRVVCRFSNYLMTLQHVEAGLSIALLPGLAVDQRYRVATRPLATPVTRTIVAVTRRASPRRAAVNAVLDALRQPPAVPAGVELHLG
ncbi:LysR family transcriptional regulator [Amycolatopsis jejuensis]|uniref:LysR family transcriptional regulator n=1 Tax=Amycolatopsis jejuensis TaxID=330084 RepID=UPI000526F41B|nr:LysR family transcriptional regulator [Amycolatopsis jejuensis]